MFVVRRAIEPYLFSYLPVYKAYISLSVCVYVPSFLLLVCFDVVFSCLYIAGVVGGEGK